LVWRVACLETLGRADDVVLPRAKVEQEWEYVKIYFD
jgi:hypothetical protein